MDIKVSSGFNVDSMKYRVTAEFIPSEQTRLALFEETVQLMAKRFVEENYDKIVVEINLDKLLGAVALEIGKKLKAGPKT